MGGAEAKDGRIQTDVGVVVAVFVGMLLLFSFCCIRVDTVLLVLVLFLDDDGSTTLGITAATNDGCFAIWALIYEVHRKGAFCAEAPAVMAAVTMTSPSDVAAANEAMRGGTAGTRELFGSAIAGIACTEAATAGTVAGAFGCGFRRIMVVHNDRRPR